MIFFWGQILSFFFYLFFIFFEFLGFFSSVNSTNFAKNLSSFLYYKIEGKKTMFRNNVFLLVNFHILVTKKLWRCK
jgi:hypothetical protein